MALPVRRLAKTIEAFMEPMVRRVDGSSPSEGSEKSRKSGTFLFGSACTSNNVHLGMELIMEPSDLEAPCEAGVFVS